MLRGIRGLAAASLCGLVCVLVCGTGSAFAANPFGGPGEGAGQLANPIGLGLDQQTGDVYVGEFYNERVSKFDGSGGFLFAWGWKVNLESPAEELQTCTIATGCRKGESGPGAGQFAGTCGAQAVAVDNDPLSLSYQDVYVVDFCHDRVQKFDSSGKFLLMFGGHVNETEDNTPGATEAQKDVCLAGEACTKGIEGTGDGEFDWAADSSDIAVGPNGAVYVGDKDRVEVFSPSGAWTENVVLPSGLTTEGKVTSLVVNSAGDMFVKIEGVPGVHELESNGAEAPVKFDEASEAVEALTLDGSGNVFVADSSGGFHVLEYSSTGKELASFGAKTAAGSKGMAFSEALDALYVSNPLESDVWKLAVPAPGPLVEPGSEVATPGLRGAARFQATIDPEGNDTSYRFEYVDDSQFEANGFANASSTPLTPVGAASQDFEEHQVEAALPAKTLIVGTTYHWRVVASDTTSQTALGAAESFEEQPSARIEGPWAADVASTSATLAARVDPLSSSTSYRLEWGTSTAYGHVLSGNVGEGVGYVPVGGFHIQGLEPDTTYHYKLITTSEAGTIESIDHSFTTQIGENELTLPDGRAWELVSPADKKGALIRPHGLYEAATEGGGITYVASDTIGEDPAGKVEVTPVISRLGPNGWRTVNVSIPGSLPVEGISGRLQGLGVFFYGSPLMLFSSDLSLAAAEQNGENPAPPLSSEATERTPYLRNNVTCVAQPSTCYSPLVTPRDVEPQGTAFGGLGAGGGGSALNVVGGTPDLSHVVLQSPLALKEGAVSHLIEEKTNAGTGKTIDGPENLYEWSQGQLQLVNVLPDGMSKPGADLGYAGEGNNDISAHALSGDGRRIVWSFGTLDEGPVELFVRDMTEKRTIKIGGRNADFQTMSSDGSRIFYREHGELYEVDFETDAQTDLTANHAPSESNAGVQDAILGASEDGSYVYFVATSVLAAGATNGADNLYVLHDGTAGWNTIFVATLSIEDEKSWFAPTTDSTIFGLHCDCGGVYHPGVISMVSGNGRFVSFMSNRFLTGYDNIDAVSGQPDEEVYLYDADSNRLACVSCNPSGARPVGVLDGTRSLLVDGERAWASEDEGASGDEREEIESGGHWLAGMTPGWLEGSDGIHGISRYQPRFLSDNGRVFFDSPDGIVPQATNGLMNVYEYEPSGVGSCTGATTTFSARSDGCVNLFSSGTSDSESDFYDASENGNDVFFITNSRLAGQDYDTAYDVYDARVCSTTVPCPAAVVTPPPCTSGDACKAAPSPQPAIFGPAPSATFSGIGNVAQTSAARPGAKSLTREQRLARALRACRAKKNRRQRSVCERLANRRYGARRSRSANATRRGKR